MSDDGEPPLARWSRLKHRARRGETTPAAPEPAPEAAPRRGAAAPVAGRRLVRSLPPLAGADQDADDPYAGPPIVQAHGLPPEPAAAAGDDASADDDNRELTPEEREAVKDLPPIESLDKDSDFTPFLADKVPDFIRRKALSVLWRSDPLLANLDGLNDYDEDFTFAAAVAESLAEAGDARKLARQANKRAKAKTAEPGKAAPADSVEPTQSAEIADAGGDVGEADGDVAELEPARLPAADDDDEGDEGDDQGADLVRPPGTPPRRH